MTNPYSILGVDKSATDEQIKDAYKELARKYSPDMYTDSPLSDLAASKMSDINAAYDQIMAERRLGSGAQASEGDSRRQPVQEATGSRGFSDARSYIDSGNPTAAENILFNVPDTARNAEWNYLMGRCCQLKGWLTEAQKYFTNAVNMDPNNNEYRTAYNGAAQSRTNPNNMNGNPYNRGYTTQSNVGGCSGCDVCSSLIAADCCCECLGGDLIRCC